MGIDRLVTALSGFSKAKSSCLVIDGGTALKFCYVSNEGSFEGGGIFPGLEIAVKCLADNTAKIPLIKIGKKPFLIGKNTKEAVQSAIYWGYVDLINGMISRYKRLDPSLKVFGTGNGLNILKNEIHLNEFDKGLLMKGLKVVGDFILKI